MDVTHRMRRNALARIRYVANRETVLARQREKWAAEKPIRDSARPARIKPRYINQRTWLKETSAPFRSMVREFKKLLTKHMRRIKDADYKRKLRNENPEKARKVMRAWREKNPQRMAELQRSWGQKNLEKRRRLGREDRLRHIEARRAANKLWRQQNPDKAKQIRDRWFAANPDKAKAIAKASRARRRALGDHVSYEVILRQIRGQKGRCWWCNIKLKKIYHADHVLALSRGGTNDASNIVISCPDCNLRKGAKTVQEFVGRLL